MLGVFFTITQLLAQNRTISGKITDDTGSPVARASVQVKGTNTGTTTDANGSFSLSVPSSATTLVVSSVGFQVQEITIGADNTVSITLTSDAKALDEMVVVAYGTQRRKAATGSIAQVSAKDIENRTFTNALNALVGAAPGIQTTTPSGAPGSSPGIIVRGFGSFSLSSAPLYVVDGVIYDGGFSNINPDDIETITVLKDASTTALYGAKGANGVVMITTKKAKKGKQNLQFKIQTGFSNPAIPQYPMVDAFQYYPLAWEAYRNGLVYGTGLGNFPTTLDSAGMIASGTLPRYTTGPNAGNQIFRGGSFQDIYQILGKYNPFNVPNTAIVGVDGRLNPNARLLYGDDLNWLDQSTRTGTRTEYGVQFSSATDRSDLFTSVGYVKEGGWGLRSDLSRFTARVNANAKVTNWFRSGFNLAGNRTKFNNASTGGIVNAFYFSRYIAPIYPVYLRDPVTGAIITDATGKPRFDFGNENGYSRPYNSGRHTIAEHLWNRNNEVRDVLSARGYGEIIFTPWLTLTTNISTDITNNESESYENPIVGDGYPAGRYSRGTSRVTSYTFNQLLNFNKQFASVHNVHFLLGHENYDYKTTGISGMRIGQSFENIYQFSNFGTINSLSSSFSASRSEGFFSRLNYDYAGKYLLSASFRRDGNSKFPVNLRWANFWSVGLGWSIDRESFFTLPWVNQLKLRASYGVTGNSNTGNYPYQAGFDIGWDDDTRAGVILQSLGSPQLTWETQKPLDIGLDFGLFQSRLYGTIGYFLRNSSGLIFSVPQPLQNGGTPSGGFSVSQNIGEMVNKGVEVQITGVPVRTKNLNWNVTVNATHYTNELTKMPDATPALTSSPFKREVGKSIYEFYTRDYYGVDPDNGSALYKGVLTFNPANSKLIPNKAGGFDTVTIDPNNARQDYVNKSSLPKVYGSLANSVTYKNFELGFVITYQIGGYVYDGVYAALMSTATNGGTFSTDILKRWQKPGDITNVPRLDNTRSAQFGAVSDRFLTSATYFSINNVSIAYQLPRSFLSSIKASSARFFISGENLHFFTKRKGMNVNGNFSGQTSDTYDAARIINAGISVNF